ncbi:MAG TPA: AAA family ATPase [Gemmatimonadales bacterium]|jgi:DNA-binding SARP family transcriptional activator|nr:AAA family ATPase [Gemmatimonadales bacterium]
MISCQTLGPVGLSMDGGPAPPELMWRKHLALLIYLARSPRGRTREHLVGLLWPEKPEPAARHSLNEAIRVLRRYLGDTSVDTTGGQVRLAPEAVSLDVERLEELADAGDWEAAAGLVAGDFLEGFAIAGASEFEDWLATERATVRHRSVDVLVHHNDELVRAGQASEAAVVAQRALALDPVSEHALQATMRSLVLAGDRTSALERYDAFSSRLKREVATAPTAETQALAERVRHERSIRPPLRTKAGEQKESESRVSLVGRQAELSLLVDAAAAAGRERASCALVIEGESGVGKTRLTEELLARLRLDGVTVAAVRAVEADQDEEWSGLVGLARSGLLQAGGLAAAPARALAVFADASPEWGDRFPSLPRDGAPLSLGRALSEILRAAADEQPVALAVDDAQWLDQASMLALLAALRDLESAPLILIFATDSVPPRIELDDLRSRLGRNVRGAAVRLRPLDWAALRVLARRMLPGFSELEIERVVRRVATDSAGLPLLAVELLRAVALGLDLRGDAGAWPDPYKTLDQTLPGDLPDTVLAAIRVDFRRLTAPAQRALSAAAVLGDRVSLDMLAHVLASPPEEVAKALDELEWHRWLVYDPRGYTFVARIVRQVIAQDMLTPGQRQRVLEAAGLSQPDSSLDSRLIAPS